MSALGAFLVTASIKGKQLQHSGRDENVDETRNGKNVFFYSRLTSIRQPQSSQMGAAYRRTVSRCELGRDSQDSMPLMVVALGAQSKQSIRQ